jgi:hypothetical protein
LIDSHFIQITPDLNLKVCMERDNIVRLDPFWVGESSLTELVRISRKNLKSFAHKKPPLADNPFFRFSDPVKNLLQSLESE